MRILDINAALGAATQSERYTDEEGLLRYMDDYRISAALTWHSLADRVPDTGNRQMVDIAAQHPERIMACLLLEPSLADLGLPGEGDALERLAQLKPGAVRVHQGDESHFLMDKFYARDLLRPLNEARMPLIVGGSYSRLFWHTLPELAEAFPHVPFIILRHGLNESRIINPLLKYTKNVYFDISTMLDCYQIEEIVEKFGSERLLFGSGLPFFVPAGALGLLMYAAISEANRRNIAYANFERLKGGVRL